MMHCCDDIQPILRTIDNIQQLPPLLIPRHAAAALRHLD